MGWRLAFGTSLLLCAAAVVTQSATATPPRPLATGFAVPLFPGEREAEAGLWLDRAAEAGGSIARIDVRWSRVAPVSWPAGFDPTNPASPAYAWDQLDAGVRLAASYRMRIMLTVYGAPSWAEAPERPDGVSLGAWRPRPDAFGAFAHALARRYDGSFPDPLNPGATLPRVSLFEAWNEPNLDIYLAPQWVGRRHVGPALYRALLNRFYAAVKREQPGATVIAGALAPFGDPPGGHRTPPVQFLRRLLCLRGARLQPVSCPRPARFDILSDHPIAVGPPLQSAGSPLDVTTPNLRRLTRVLRAAERTRRVRPRGRHRPLWVTEFWYDSSPPDPRGVPLHRQARWYAQDLYLFWRQGARVAVALELRDSPEGRGYPFSTQSGVYFLDGTPKPSRTAFRFPLVARRLTPHSVQVWGIAPQSGRVRIETRRGGRWRRLATLGTRGRPRPFVTVLALSAPAALRARLGAEASLTWRQH